MAARTIEWTDDLIADLKRLWADGVSISAIGTALGVSAGAVNRRVRKLALPMRGADVAQASVDRQERAAELLRAGSTMRAASRDAGVSIHTARRIAREIGCEAAVPKPDAPAPAAKPLSRPSAPILYRIQSASGSGPGIGMADMAVGNLCRWPLWKNSSRPTFRCCGAPSSPGRPYCAEHSAVAYRTIEEPGAKVAA